MDAPLTTEAAEFETTFFPNILSDIETESCVLIIGPDLFDYEGKSFFEVLSEELQKDAFCKSQLELAPQYVFLHEELLQLKPGARESTILRYMDEFYQKQTQFDDPFRKIAQIPFHLIISLLPDDRLKKIYEEQNLGFNYSHYTRDQNPDPVDKPTRKTPLIYNILGELFTGDVILTFDHLFEYLSGIMGERKLPEKVRESFKRARTFLFLGVHFERWYVQLLLRIITEKGKMEKYSFLKNGGGSDVYTLIAKRLELNFVPDEPIAFLDSLYKACYDQKLLKAGPTPFSSRVFISYSHSDEKTAQQIHDVLREKNIEVMIDRTDMPGGEKILEFIKKIASVHCVLVIVSKDSLLSPWVMQEIRTTLDKPGKYLLPCAIDDSLGDPGLMDIAQKKVMEKISGIDAQITARKWGKVDDLFSERTLWTEYFNYLPTALAELKGRKYLSLKDGDFPSTMTEVTKILLSIK